MGKQTLALLAALKTACTSVNVLGLAAAELFQTHPDYAILTGFPGLGDSTGVRVRAEIGDDRARSVRRPLGVGGHRGAWTGRPPHPAEFRPFDPTDCDEGQQAVRGGLGNQTAYVI
jgi:hypothetical protein